jgi:HAD superfamily hydrolase (TIGR01509 family)
MDALFLDLDGTLVDTEPYWVESQHLLTDRYGVGWSHEDELSLVGHSMLHAAQKLAGAGVNLSQQDIVDFRLGHVLSKLEREIPWKPGALSLLQDVRESGLPCALVTMSPRPMAATVIGALPPSQFHATITGSDCLHGKPHPEPYLRALALLDVAAERSIAVEDSTPGVESAERAGLQVIVVPGLVPVGPGLNRTHVPSLEGIERSIFNATPMVP